MIESTNPAAGGPSDVSHGIAPRFLTAAEMRDHQACGAAVPMSPNQERHQLLVRYDKTWWIGNHEGFLEITSPSQNAKLDHWHQRIANGALWAR